MADDEIFMTKARQITQYRNGVWSRAAAAAGMRRNHDGCSLRFKPPDEEETRAAFLAALSHELKNPITGLRLSVQLLRRQIDSDERSDLVSARDLIESIDRQSEKLTHLVNYLVDASRIGAKSVPLNMQETDLVALAQAVAEAAQQLSDRHQIVVDAPAPVHAVVDSPRIEQALLNLLDNAIKYSPEGGLIRVDLARDGPIMICVGVRDHGVGVTAEHRAQMFDRFSPSHDPLLPGLGLGLFLSRRIIELHGGQLTAEFPADGGTRIVMRLPPGSEGARARHRSLPGTGRVLVVEDEPSIRETLEVLINIEGCEVQSTGDGSDALALVQTWSPDLILLDLTLPGLSGAEFIRAYQQLPGAHAPVILMTAHNMTSDGAKELGAVGVLPKPFSIDELLDMVSEFVDCQAS
ncbi:MAG: multi-sensor hybrid histidine kinase [Chloroflexi bacterium]|nr:multi-sensor hybrid histidine kinase [Chloroflexota bacterium]